MAVAIDTKTSTTAGSSGSLGITVGNNPNRCLVAVSWANLTGVTFNGVAPDATVGSLSAGTMYIFMNPAVGTNNFVWTGGGASSPLGLISLYNVNAYFNFGSASGTGTGQQPVFIETTYNDNSFIISACRLASSTHALNFTSGTSWLGISGYTNGYQSASGAGNATVSYSETDVTTWNVFAIILVQYVLPTVTTTAISTQDAQGYPVLTGGTVTYDGGAGIISEGVVYDLASHTLPGNVAPASSGYAESISPISVIDGAFSNLPIFDMLNGAVIIDSYALANQNNEFPVYATFPSVGQTISVSKTSVINTASFIAKIVGTVTGNVTASIYAITGSFGSTAVPTGSALATSDNINITSISTSYQTVTFTFSGANKITLTSGTNYALVVNYSGGSGGNVLELGVNIGTPTADGNFVFYVSGSWDSGGTSTAMTYVLSGAITYYARAYVQTSIGYAYGSEVNFTTNYKINLMGSD